MIFLTVFIFILSLFAQQGKTVTDADGNIYNTVKLGNLIWTVENWRSTKFSDGTPIPYVTSDMKWDKRSERKKASFCYYKNDTTNGSKYGALYNWFAVNSGKFAPEGWRVPTDADWAKLEAYLIVNGYNWDDSDDSNKIGKSLAAKTGWETNNKTGTIGNSLQENNSSGFSALPGGYHDYNIFSWAMFSYIGGIGYWWSATENPDMNYQAFCRTLYAGLDAFYKNSESKGYGFSVRIVQDSYYDPPTK